MQGIITITIDKKDKSHEHKELIVPFGGGMPCRDIINDATNYINGMIFSMLQYPFMDTVENISINVVRLEK